MRTPHLRIAFAMGQQFLVSFSCFYPVWSEKYHLVCIGNGAEAMGDNDDGFVFNETAECLLDEVFVFRVAEGRGFIQNKDGGIF